MIAAPLPSSISHRPGIHETDWHGLHDRLLAVLLPCDPPVCHGTKQRYFDDALERKAIIAPLQATS
jgi:hypothetical protein